MRQEIVVASRQSRLAVVQAETVCAFLRQADPGCSVRLLTMETTGDRMPEREFREYGEKGLFVKELDRALREGRCDLAVHSMKDLPLVLPEDLPVLACSAREDARDVLVLPKGGEKLDPSLPVGCSGRRRIVQLARLLPDVKIRPVRGNVPTRLRKLDEGEYGALVLAAAGLKRLGLSERISRYFSPEEMIPAAGQGILAVQGRRDWDASCLEAFNDREAQTAARAERSFVRALGGGCSSPTAAYAVVTGQELSLTGLFYDEERSTCRVGSCDGSAAEAEGIGESLAFDLRRAKGGKRDG